MKSKFKKKDILTFYNNKKISDKRGYFFKVFNFLDFKKKPSLQHNVRQVNISNNIKKGTIRGLHYQINRSREQKIIICLKGSIYDVIVDARPGSKNYLKVYVNILSDKNQKILVIPPGFAHGYQTLKKETLLMYIHSNTYSKKDERGLNPFDKRLKIKWPINKFIISKKDLKN